jgi:hypothetical protein
LNWFLCLECALYPIFRILNANAKVSPLAVYPGVMREVMDQFINEGDGPVKIFFYY